MNPSHVEKEFEQLVRWCGLIFFFFHSRSSEFPFNWKFSIIHVHKIVQIEILFKWLLEV